MPESPLWSPSPERIAAANLTRFMQEVGAQQGMSFDGYDALYDWSISQPEAFWRAIWDFCGVIGDGPGAVALADPDKMPGAQFFPEAKINFAENLLRRRDDSDAMVFWAEDKVKRRMS